MTLPLASVKEGPYLVSRWLKIQVLLDASELQALMTELSPFSIFCVSSVVDKSSAGVLHQLFYESYLSYITALKRGEAIDEQETQHLFSSVWTRTLDSLYTQEINEEKLIIRIKEPVIQLRPASFVFSSLDQKIYPMVKGKQSISWGLEFSYPHLYQDPHTKDVCSVAKEKRFVNTAFFRQLMRFLRKASLPVTFIKDDLSLTTSLRIGKKMIPDIMHHPQLLKHHLSVKE